MRLPPLIFPPIQLVEFWLIGQRRQPWYAQEQKLEQGPITAISGGVTGLFRAMDKDFAHAIEDPPFPSELTALFDDPRTSHGG
jgi:hypothetical protein